MTADRCQIASRRAWEASRPRRACTACDLLHCLAWIHNRGVPFLHSYIPYYNRRSVLNCTASGVALVSEYALEVLRRCETLQRSAGGIIAACVGLVFAAVEWGNHRKIACKALCAVL
nr:MAG TPA: hypothetical protein [Caudoviricetes sp.]